MCDQRCVIAVHRAWCVEQHGQQILPDIPNSRCVLLQAVHDETDMINISMNTAPYFENGKAEGNVMIVNESINNYPQQVEFIRNDTQEIIYQSKAIPVGSKIERAALAVELPAGTYECTAMFHNLDPETGNVIGTAGAIITITIKN